MLEIKLHGMKEVEEALKQLPDKLQKRYMAQAVKAGAEVIAETARARCPVSLKGTQKSRYQSRVHDPGNLKRSIKVYTAKLSELKNRSKYWGIPIGIRHEKFMKTSGVYIMRKSPYDAWYWHMVAGGHRTVKMGGKPKMGKLGTLRSRTLEPKGFVKANPFLREAFATNKQRVISMITAKLNMAIQNARTTL